MKEPFEELFRKNNWDPIEYKGKTVCIGDTFPIPKGKVKFIIRIEQVNSDYEQGIFFKGKGPFTVNEPVINSCDEVIT